MPKYLGDVRYWVNSGKHLLSLSFSGFDPDVWSGRALQVDFAELAVRYFRDGDSPSRISRYTAEADRDSCCNTSVKSHGLIGG